MSVTSEGILTSSFDRMVYGKRLCECVTAVVDLLS